MVGLMTLIPAHNVLTEPYYWYENTILIPNVGWNLLFITAFFLQLEFWSNITCIQSISTWIFLQMIFALTTIIFEGTYHYLWMEILGFYPPAPFNGYVGGTICIFTCFATAWIRSDMSYF